MADIETSESVQMDLSDVGHRVGRAVVGGQLLEPVAESDIRRWVLAMDPVNPVLGDRKFAAMTRFGDIIAPQSPAVALDDSYVSAARAHIGASMPSKSARGAYCYGATAAAWNTDCLAFWVGHGMVRDATLDVRTRDDEQPGRR